MIVVSVKADITRALEKLKAAARDQMPYARTVALTRSAKAAQVRLRDEMNRVFQSPTPYTLNSTYVSPATKSKAVALVKIKDQSFKGNPAVRFLTPEVEGGERNVKAFENLLIRNGAMPSGWFAVPGTGAPLDGYGNVPGSLIVKILSQLNSSRDPAQNMSSVRRRRIRHAPQGRYFVVNPDNPPTNNLKPGIYEILGGAGKGTHNISCVFLFVRKRPTYQSRYHFSDVGEEAARAVFPEEFDRALKEAIATAR